MSGRGGRGGGRGGRGGGRGGFQGDRPRGGPEGVAVGTLTHADLQRTVKTERLYPVSPPTQLVTHEHDLFSRAVA
jgi:hypothetical protein